MLPIVLVPAEWCFLWQTDVLCVHLSVRVRRIELRYRCGCMRIPLARLHLCWTAVSMNKWMHVLEPPNPFTSMATSLSPWSWNWSLFVEQWRPCTLRLRFGASRPSGWPSVKWSKLVLLFISTWPLQSYQTMLTMPLLLFSSPGATELYSTWNANKHKLVSPAACIHISNSNSIRTRFNLRTERVCVRTFSLANAVPGTMRWFPRLSLPKSSDIIIELKQLIKHKWCKQASDWAVWMVWARVRPQWHIQWTLIGSIDVTSPLDGHSTIVIERNGWISMFSISSRCTRGHCHTWSSLMVAVHSIANSSSSLSSGFDCPSVPLRLANRWHMVRWLHL